MDLHIHALTDDYNNLQPNAILRIQVDHFITSLENAIIQKIPRMVFIHGGGKGVLKAEIIKRLNDYEGVHYFDASHAKYGTGAIEVYIKHQG